MEDRRRRRARAHRCPPAPGRRLPSTVPAAGRRRPQPRPDRRLPARTAGGEQGRGHDRRPTPEPTRATPRAPRADLLALVPGVPRLPPRGLGRDAHLRRRAARRSTPASTCPTDAGALRGAGRLPRPSRARGTGVRGSPSCSTPTTPALAERAASTSSRTGWSGGGVEVVCARARRRRRWWALAPRPAADPGTRPTTWRAPVHGAGGRRRAVVLAQPPRAGRHPGRPTRRPRRRSPRCEAVAAAARLAAGPRTRRAPGRRGARGCGRRVRRCARATGDRLDADDVARLLVAAARLRRGPRRRLGRDDARQRRAATSTSGATSCAGRPRTCGRRRRPCSASRPGWPATARSPGARSTCAQEADPDYSLAGLLAEALAGAVPPSAWQPLAPGGARRYAGADGACCRAGRP